MSKDLRTKAFVLRRTNYGEADRILNLITPEGKKSVLAKGVRKEKSKLAGGIEMFCLSEIVLHEGKSDLNVLTSAKMLKFYQNILKDFDRLNLASDILKKINKFSEYVTAQEYFDILKQSFEALNDSANLAVVESWFLMNLAKVNGETINLIRDTDGNKLEQDQNYVWDSIEKALKVQQSGTINADKIKLMRLILSNKLEIILKINNVAEIIEDVLYIAKSVV